MKRNVRRLALPRRLSQVLARTHFDKSFYLRRYDDVKKSGVEPFLHFMTFGWREARDPSARFNTLFYKDAYMDPEDDENPLLNFIRTFKDGHGTPRSGEEFLAVQRRVVAPLFDESFYRSAYGLPADKSCIDHYLVEGWRLGREPNRVFSSSHYLSVHGHVKALDVSPFYHFVSTQPKSAARFSKSKRGVEIESTTGKLDVLRLLEDNEVVVLSTIRPYFDERFYLQTNKDVRGGVLSAIEHYARYGWKEGRNPSLLFDTNYYISTNDDVRASGINPLYHYACIGEKEERLPNPIGRSLWPKVQAPLLSDWKRLAPTAEIAEAEIAIIVPVYKGYADTLRTIYSVLDTPQKLKYALVVVNDRSPDEELTEALRSVASMRLFTYLENEKNLGFVRTTNKGMALTADLDVVLLNSDTVVFGDWLDRLVEHPRRDPSIATVTPFSNNASICSYPLIDRNNVIQLEVTPGEIDSIAAKGNRHLNVEVPTGVGFCFYIRRKVLEELGDFDIAAFGRGYGEENDLCMRAVKAGYKNVLAGDIFVYHSGQVSFAMIADEEYEPGQKALILKHPDYPVRVRRYYQADAGWELRARLDLVRLARSFDRPTFVYVLHSWSGGIVTHAHDMAAALEKEGCAVVTLRVGTQRDEDVEIIIDGNVEVFTPSLRAFSLLRYSHLIEQFLQALQPKMVHVHSLAGLRWTAAEVLLDAIKAAKVPFAYTFHDYFSVCHRNNLTLVDGRFCGLPETNVCRGCIASDLGYLSPVDPDVRRNVFGSFVSGAARLYAPSEDVKARIASVYPRAEIDVRAHHETLSRVDWRPIPKAMRPLKVVVIGAIGPHKGSGILHMMATDIRARKLPIEIYVIGFSDISDELQKLGVQESGEYKDDSQVFGEIERIRPHLALFPSIWPETYCYTLSFAFSAGLPPVVFDIGAPAERLRALKTGTILPYALTNAPQTINDELLKLDIEQLWEDRFLPAAVRYESVYRDYYDLGPVPKQPIELAAEDTEAAA